MKQDCEVVCELEKFVERGYLLHGSRHLFDVVKPAKKSFLSAKAGKIRAVYATDSVAIAMFKAVVNAAKMPKIGGMRGGVIGWSFLDGEPKFWVSPNYVTYKAFGVGYVYVLDGSKFTKLKKLPHEYYVRSVIAPVRIVTVKPNDFLRGRSLKIWPEAEIRRRKRYTEEEIRMMGY